MIWPVFVPMLFMTDVVPPLSTHRHMCFHDLMVRVSLQMSDIHGSNISVKILTLEKQTRHQRAFLETQFEKLTLNTKDFENWTSLGDISARAYTLGLKLLALMPQNGSWIPPSTSRASPRKVGALPLSNF